MKHEWKRNEKQFYQPKSKPEQLIVPKFSFFVLEGEGDPNDAFFGEYIAVLYALSYAVKMSIKKQDAPQGYYDYTVYPLEGVWDLKEEARGAPDGRFDKRDLRFRLMIRQPDFVNMDFAKRIIKQVQQNKPNKLFNQVRFEEIAEGGCIQMLHIGSYDSEPVSFGLMEKFAREQGYRRTEKVHREIYLNDARKVAPEKLKTVLRFGVEKIA